MPLHLPNVSLRSNKAHAIELRGSPSSYLNAETIFKFMGFGCLPGEL